MLGQLLQVLNQLGLGFLVHVIHNQIRVLLLLGLWKPTLTKYMPLAQQIFTLA